MKVGLDVDNVVCATDWAWWEWLISVTESRKPPYLYTDFIELRNNVSSQLHKLFEKELAEVNRDGLDFFRSEHCYDYCYPVGGAQEAVQYLKEKGHEIVFISHIKGNHNKNKFWWLKQYFPYLDGYLGTQEKWYVKCDVFVDDTIHHCNKYKEENPEALVINFATPYIQSDVLNSQCYRLNGWESVVKLIEEKERYDE